MILPKNPLVLFKGPCEVLLNTPVEVDASTRSSLSFLLTDSLLIWKNFELSVIDLLFIKLLRFKDLEILSADFLVEKTDSLSFDRESLIPDKLLPD